MDDYVLDARVEHIHNFVHILSRSACLRSSTSA